MNGQESGGQHEFISSEQYANSGRHIGEDVVVVVVGATVVVVGPEVVVVVVVVVGAAVVVEVVGAVVVVGAAVVVVVLGTGMTNPDPVHWLAGRQRELPLLYPQQTHPPAQTPGLLAQTTLPHWTCMAWAPAREPTRPAARAASEPMRPRRVLGEASERARRSNER